MVDVDNKKENDLDFELELLKSVFKDNDKLLKVIRGVMLGFDLSDGDKELLKSTFSNKTLLEAVRKKFYPVMTNDVDIGVLPDPWVGIETQIQDKTPETIKQIIDSKHESLEMLKFGVSLLENPFDGKVELDFNPKDELNDPYRIKLLSRVLYMKSVNGGLGFIKMLANSKEKSQSEILAKIKKDSSK